ncbi:MAG: DUF2318 domain-containing protein [Nitrospirae bacterium]|nr:DUF2318 domain-containing protein [Nitrospirota bacterium]
MKAASTVALFFILTLSALPGCSRLPVEHQRVTASANEIRIPLKEVSDGKVHFFTYRKSGEKINFFIRTDGRGVLSAYFDACFTCHKHKKGYRAEGTDLICNECSMKFILADEKWDNAQGCSPIMLRSRTEGEYLILKKDDVEKGVKLFSKNAAEMSKEYARITSPAQIYKS